MKATSQELLQILKATQEAGNPRSTMAIVSPCSRCTNQRAVAANNLSPCPRRYWDNVAQQAANSGDAPPPAYLTRHNQANSGQQYENPVYIGDLNVILVWIAAVEENREILDPSGNAVNPSILEMSVSGSGTGPFDTDYITCHNFPCIPAVHSASFFQGGQFCEGERLLMTQTKMQQLHQDNSPVSIAGFVQRASVLFDVDIDRPSRDTNPGGT